MGLLIKLKNGDTSLKSLKFGNDRPGGGDSGQPFIKDPIDQPPSITNEDSIIRGGLKAPLNSLEDVSRLSKYFFNNKSSNGTLFAVKQNILSRISPKTEASFGLGYGGLSRNVNLSTGQTSVNQNNGFFNAGIYTPLSTLAQAGVNFSGTHLNKQGLDPTGLSSALSINKYQEVVYKNNLVKNNNVSGIVPLSLVNKSKRASNRAGRKLQKLREQETKTSNQLNSSPENTDIFTNNILVPIAPKPFTFLNEQANKFLQKWDQYVDERAKKKLEKAETASDQAFNRSDSLYNQVLEEEATVRYSNRLLNLWNNIGFNPESNSASNSPFIYSYSGGSNSVLGIGNTSIKFATKNDGLTPLRTDEGLFYEDYKRLVTYRTPNIFGDSTTPSVSLKYFENTRFVKEEEMFGSKDYLSNYDNTSDKNLGLRNNQSSLSSKFATWEKDDFNKETLNIDSKTKPDFRSADTIQLSPYAKSFISKSPDYENDNYQRRFNIGKNNDPGQRGDRSDYVAGKKNIQGTKILGAVDTINTIPVYRSAKGDLSLTDQYKEVEDFCEFKFAILDTISNGNDKFYLHFRALLDGFKDNYGAKYNNIKYLGRGEEFYKYGGYSRTLSFSFRAVALSKQELVPLYRKLNFLASSLAPSYTKKGYMGGTITEVTVGSYLFNQPGIITSMNISIPEESPWEIGITNGRTVNVTNEAGDIISDSRDPSTQVMPYMVKVDVNFTPIHNFRVQAQYGDSSTIMTREELIKNLTDKVNNIDNNEYGIEKYINLRNKVSDGYANNDLPPDNGNIASQTLDQKGEIKRFGIPPEEIAPSNTSTPPPGTGTVLSNQPSNPLLGNLQQQAGIPDPAEPGSGVISYP